MNVQGTKERRSACARAEGRGVLFQIGFLKEAGAHGTKGKRERGKNLSAVRKQVERHGNVSWWWNGFSKIDDAGGGVRLALRLEF